MSPSALVTGVDQKPAEAPEAIGVTMGAAPADRSSARPFADTCGVSAKWRIPSATSAQTITP
ncbi:hypothetical protein GCM10012280_31330 [Wenjunlia tyrosinilytica]|uniref:Uncharacterized protein n=1 Tax=Wenjunlia tyrosinilytica TaxID=1544741 RepID=A0A917ZQL3_9ACTN|nr:hypothetical protein GCM10012280_31330 [Wenjunlia tyrosinilytica]